MRINNNYFICIILYIVILISGCEIVTADPTSNNVIENNVESSIIHLPEKPLLVKIDCKYSWLPEKYDVKRRISSIPCPEGFNRTVLNKNSFQYWLRHIPMKKFGSPVKLHNGLLKNNQTVHFSVLDIDTGKKNLQQCADAVMRFRAEYLYSQKEYDSINFNFVSGFKAVYSKWIKGNRIKIRNNKCKWSKSAEYSEKYRVFMKYMDMVFSYANTASLSKELKKIKSLKNMKIGDVFIKGGFPGHAVIIVDMAENEVGNKIFLLAQSYMPAQDIHILKSPFLISPWYKCEFDGNLVTPEWEFKKTDLKRF